MAAVTRLYNPFRDGEDEDATTDNPSAAFNFEIGQSDFPLLSKSSSTNNNNNNKQQQQHNQKQQVAADPESPSFDPFQVVTPEKEKQKKKTHPKQTTSHNSASTSKSATTGTRSFAPKLIIKLSTHEEVTSCMKMAMDDFDSTSEITIEGTVLAQVQCSDARKNTPFALLIPPALAAVNTADNSTSSFSLQPNPAYSSNAVKARNNVPVVVTIPKQDVMAVPIAKYTLQKEVRFMPVLVERKITRNGQRVRIAVQIRSRLDNAGDMKDLTILVAVPEKVNGNTVQVARGQGVWDESKRTIKWKVADLVKGQSELVVAEADLWNSPAPDDDEVPFPVMFRCSSIADSIGTPVDWKVAQVSGSPSHIATMPTTHDFRLLHRLL